MKKLITIIFLSSTLLFNTNTLKSMAQEEETIAAKESAKINLELLDSIDAKLAEIELEYERTDTTNKEAIKKLRQKCVDLYEKYKDILDRDKSSYSSNIKASICSMIFTLDLQINGQSKNFLKIIKKFVQSKPKN